MSFAFARGFLALGAVVGELRRFGGMVALSFAPFAIPAAVLSLGPLARGWSLANVAISDQRCRGGAYLPRYAASVVVVQSCGSP